MEKSILALNAFVPIVVGIAIFTLLWVVIFKTLRQAPFFKSQAVEATVATCVSLLSVIGMFQFLGTGESTYRVAEKIGGDRANVDMILLPYAALGIAIILLALYLLSRRLLGNNESRKSLGDVERRTDSAFRFDIGKGDEPAADNLTKAFPERGVIHDDNRSPKLICRPPEERLHRAEIRKETKSNQTKR